MHKFTSASAQRLITRIQKRAKVEDPKFAALVQKVAAGQRPEGVEETLLLDVAKRVGA